MEQDQLLNKTPRSSTESRPSSTISEAPERGQLYIKIIEARNLTNQEKNSLEGK
jgi:hypothetical protein